MSKQTEFSHVNAIVIEDNLDHQDIMKVYMNRTGVKVDFFERGQDLLDYLEQEPRVDLIFTDIRMPGLSGEETVQLLRAGGWEVPVIGTSAFVSQEEQEKLLEKGFTEIVLKPLNLPKIMDILEKYSPSKSQ